MLYVTADFGSTEHVNLRRHLFFQHNMSAFAGIVIGATVGGTIGFVCFIVLCFKCCERRDLRNRKLAAEEKARRLHQTLINDGGRYDPESNRYYNNNGLVTPLIISVGPGMAIVGIVV